MPATVRPMLVGHRLRNNQDHTTESLVRRTGLKIGWAATCIGGIRLENLTWGQLTNVRFTPNSGHGEAQLSFSPCKQQSAGGAALLLARAEFLLNPQTV